MQLSRTGNGHVDSSDSFVASLKGGGKGVGWLRAPQNPPAFALGTWHIQAL